MSKIKSVKAREILDSRGNPTVEVEVLTDKAWGRAAVPSGASTGTHEALELRDGAVKGASAAARQRYMGKGVLTAVNNVNTSLARLVKGMSVFDQEKIDLAMIKKDGTANKSRFGANAILGISMAVARAAAAERKVSLYKYLNEDASLLPVPQMNILNGGVHADSGLDFQEFMILPVGAENFHEALRTGAEIFHTLGGILKSKGFKTTVGDEGGFAPALKGQEEAFDLILMAIEKAGYKVGSDVMLGIDAAASEFYDAKKKVYKLKVKGKVQELKGPEMVDYILALTKKYPLINVEDGLAEDDFANWTMLREKSKGKFQIVGDDLFVTNVDRLKMGLEKKMANSILIKLNQIGSLTETVEAIELAEENDWTCVISHRSGETEDSFIADLAVGMGTGQIKTGSLSRSERICKYNQLMRIEEELGKKGIYAGYGAFYNLS